jgi:ketosteroid isomerase-like protein
MKTLTKSILKVLCITLLSSAQLFGQEWSEEQKDAWKFIETSWDQWAKEDIEGVLANFHDDFSGWENDAPLPNNKAFFRKNIALWLETGDMLTYNIQPVAIKVFDNVAIVHYYWSNVIKDTKGNVNNDNGRWTDIIMKQGDKWVFIADSVGSTK